MLKSRPLRVGVKTLHNADVYKIILRKRNKDALLRNKDIELVPFKRKTIFSKPTGLLRNFTTHLHWVFFYTGTFWPFIL